MSKASNRKKHKPIEHRTLKIQVLNVGEGDLKVSFNSGIPADIAQAKKMVTDLLRQGYAIMVEAGKDNQGRSLFRRVTDFDPETCEYVVIGEPELPATADQIQKIDAILEKKGRGRPRGPYRVPASAPVVAVGRTAGGYDPIVLRNLRRGGNLDTLPVQLP